MSYQKLENEQKVEYERTGVLVAELFIPKQLLEVFEKKKIRPHMKDNAARACTTIIKRGGKHVFEGEYIRVPFEAFGIRRNSTKGTLDYLIQNKIIVSDGQASHPQMPKGKRKNFGPNRSNGYRFAVPIVEADLVSYTLQGKQPTPKVVATAVPSPVVEERGNLTATQKLLARKMLEFDADAKALQKIENAASGSITGHLQVQFYADRFRQKQHYASRASTGRLFTTFTSCPKSLRAALHVNGEPLAELDASCCNPLLSCRLMLEAGVKPADLATFKAWTEGGTLYDEIARALATDRDTVKRLILSYFCGPHNFRKSRLALTLKKAQHQSEHPQIKADFCMLQQIARWFKTTLPAVDDFLKELKKPSPAYWGSAKTAANRTGTPVKGPHSIVSQKLQRMESDVIIEDCCKNIFAKHPKAVISTIHDCLLVPVSFIETAKAELHSSFASLGLTPTIKVSHLAAV